MTRQPMTTNPPAMKPALRRHLWMRLGFFLLGVVLFYAPMAILVRLLLHATNTPLLPDAHRICLRMPFEWVLQPWMYPTLVRNPLFLIGLVVLPAIAFVVGPLFCGWLCPAGSFTEFLGRLVPERLKLSLGGKLNPSPIRYGVLIGMFLSPFLGGYICCTYCNFTMMQNIVAALFGSPEALMAWSSFTLLTFVLWFFALGIFVKGGRGFCNLLCPAGAVQGLAHALGRRFRFTRAVQIDRAQCIDCRQCAVNCPAWAIAHQAVNRHACNGCRDCLYICPSNAIAYRATDIKSPL